MENYFLEDEYFGVDIGSARTDDLDKKVLEDIERHKGEEIRIFNGGSGAPPQSIAMVETGATRVRSVDLGNYIIAYEEIQNDFPEITFEGRNMLEWLREYQDSGKIFDLAVLQRVIHYFSYDQAQEILYHLRNLTRSRLYISVTGMNTAIAQEIARPEYMNLSVSERFDTLTEEGKKRFSITQPVCLYTEKEFRELLERSGWMIKEMRESDFGNYKAVCD